MLKDFQETEVVRARQDLAVKTMDEALKAMDPMAKMMRLIDTGTKHLDFLQSVGTTIALVSASVSNGIFPLLKGGVARHQGPNCASYRERALHCGLYCPLCWFRI